MSDMIYRPLLEDMVWSYSNISSFEGCRYKWFLRYIKHIKPEDKFYASYGSFIHKILEKYYTGEMEKEDMLSYFLSNFHKEVKGKRPNNNIVKKYIENGARYFRDFEPLPFKLVSIEEKIIFNLNGNKFTVIIDYLGEDEDGNYVIVDNKSRDLKKRSNRSEPTVKDKELDSMLKQLYLYAGAVKEKYGKFPKRLCFNCFKSGVFIDEPFIESVYNDVVKWATDLIEEIKDTSDFFPSWEFFLCTNLCGVNKECCYDVNERRSMWRNKKK